MTLSISKARDVEKQTKDRRTQLPPTDIFENREELLLVMDVPGVTEETLNVHFEKGKLTVDGGRSDFEDRPLDAEFSPRNYYRGFSVPQGIDVDRVTAEIKHGQLRIHLPKTEALKPKQIAIKTS